jgi:hypothetical protein
VRRASIGVVLAFSVWAPGAGLADTASNEAAAQSDAAALLAAAPLPPGAVRSATEPAGDGSVLAQPAIRVGAADLVDDHGWWIVRSGLDVLSYIAAHRPAGTKVTTTGSGGGPNVPASRFEAIDWPAIHGVLSSRELVVYAVTLPDGSTAVRLDAEVVWLTARSPSELIPSRTQRVTIAVLGPANRVVQGPLSVTDAKAVKRVVALLNGLGVAQPGPVFCPADFGTRIRLAFHAGSGAPPLAVANIDPGGCLNVSLTIGGHAQPALAGSTAPGSSLVSDLDAALGVRLQTGAPRR